MKRFLATVLTICLLSSINIVRADGTIGDSIHAVHYTINLEEISTADQTIKGWTEITIVSLVNDLDYIPLELKYLNVDSTKVNGASKSFVHIDERLTIIPNQTLAINDTVTVKVFYQGTPFHEAWGGFHFSGDYAFNLGVGFESIPHNLGKTWFPCIDNFTDRATYDVIGTAENGKTITAGGYLVDTIHNSNNTITWHWRIPHPIPTYLASIALGEYIEHKDIHINGNDTIDISIFTRPSDTGDVAGSFVNLHPVIDFFITHFGEYPFEKIGYTGTAIGAMEHASNIAYPNSTINGGTSYEYLYAHELAHMWFGNKVTCSTAEDMWLNEGWATFCELYYKKILYDYETYLNEMRSMRKDVLQNCHIEDGGYWALNNVPQEVTYGKTSYDKGGTVVASLMNYIGDSLFFEAMTAYLANDTIKYTSRSSEELRDYLTQYTGMDMDGFFEAWVMTPGTPHFSIDSVSIFEGGASYMIDIYTKQKYNGYDFLADDNKLEITMVDSDFNFFSDTIHFSGKTSHSQKIYDMATLTFKPEVVFIDLYEKTNDATIDNFNYFTEPEQYTFPETFFTLNTLNNSDSALIRATHSWVEPDSLKTPVEGLTLSPYRHWKIEGVFPDDFQATGQFFYTTSNLDNTLITSPKDSVVILYREQPSEEWESVPQTRFGAWSVGNIIVDELLPGEYTLAVWDTQIVNVKDNPENLDVKIYPNPGKGKVNIRFNKKGIYTVRVFDDSGRKIDDFVISSKKIQWEPTSYDSTGTFIFNISENGRVISNEKVVILK